MTRVTKQGDRADALSRREFLVRAGAGGVALLFPWIPPTSAVRLSVGARPDAETSLVMTWNQAALQGVRDSRLGPPMVARALAIVHTCAFDAWAAYDHRAVGTRLGSQATRRRSSIR